MVGKAIGLLLIHARQYITYATAVHHHGIITGKKEDKFNSMTEFNQWKERNYLYYLCEARQNLPPSKQQ